MPRFIVLLARENILLLCFGIDEETGFRCNATNVCGKQFRNEKLGAPLFFCEGNLYISMVLAFRRLNDCIEGDFSTESPLRSNAAQRQFETHSEWFAHGEQAALPSPDRISGGSACFPNTQRARM